MIFHQISLFRVRNPSSIEISRKDYDDCPSKIAELILSLKTIFQIYSSSLINRKII